jgi:ribosome-associated toxin RatA of RatAB toxin-antitoxin module
MKVRYFIYILSYGMMFSFLLQVSTGTSINLDWEKLFNGNIIVDTVSNGEGVPGIKLLMTVTTSRDNIWKTLTDYENYSHIFKGIEKIEIVKQENEGVYVEFWIDAVITKYHYVLYRHHEKLQGRIRWKRISGDLERVEGSWEIHDTPRPEAKLLIYKSYVKVESMMPKSMLRWGAIRHARAMGKRLRQILEALPSKN